jgi:hypothetical protein
MILSFSGVVHQIAGASLFVTLPLAALLAVRGLAELPEWRGTVQVVRWSAIGSLVFAVAYLIARLPDIAPNTAMGIWIGELAVGGLAQRVLFGFEMVLLMVLAVQLFRVARGTAAARAGNGMIGT